MVQQYKADTSKTCHRYMAAMQRRVRTTESPTPRPCLTLKLVLKSHG